MNADDLKLQRKVAAIVVAGLVDRTRERRLFIAIMLLVGIEVLRTGLAVAGI